MKSIELNKSLILIVIGFFSHLAFKFPIGVIRLGELVAMTYLILNLLKCINFIARRKYTKTLFYLLAFSLCIGVLSSLINKTPSSLFFKGLAGYIFSFSTLFALLLLLKNNLRQGAIFFLLSFGIGAIFFNPYVAISINEVDVMKEDETSFFDMFIVPVATPLILAFCLLVKEKHIWIVILISCFYGLLSFIGDARSNGLIFIFGSCLLLLKLMKFKFSPFSLHILVFFVPILLIPPFQWMLGNGYLGTNSAEYSLELSKKVDAFNPFLLISRPDPIVALIAFADSPLYGHGYNKQESKYTLLAKVAGFIPDDWDFTIEGIPSHSILLNAMVEVGILGILLWIYVLRLAIIALAWMYDRVLNPFSPFVVFAFVSIFWNILFSPLGYIRFSMPIELSVLILLIDRIEYKKDLNQ